MFPLSTFVHFLRALLLATQTQKSRWRQEHGFEPSPSDGEGRERVTKTANDLDRLRIRLVVYQTESFLVSFVSGASSSDSMAEGPSWISSTVNWSREVLMSSKDFVMVDCSVASGFTNSELMLLIAATISVEPLSDGAGMAFSATVLACFIHPCETSELASEG